MIDKLKPGPARWRRFPVDEAHELVRDGEKLGHVDANGTWYRSPESTRPTSRGKAASVAAAKSAVVRLMKADRKATQG